MCTIELAARCAVVPWFDREWPLAQEVQAAQNFDEIFIRRWLTYWMLARTVGRENRHALCHFLYQARCRLADTSISGNKAFKLVEELADEGGRLPIFRGRPISLMSKFAFSCRPKLFSPTDNRARNGLRTLGYNVTAQDYVGFMDAFREQTKEFSERARQAGVVAENLIFKDNVMPCSLFWRRGCDKYLMLLGGFSEERMQNRILRANFGF